LTNLLYLNQKKYQHQISRPHQFIVTFVMTSLFQLSTLAIFQQHQHLELTFYNLYVWNCQMW